MAAPNITVTIASESSYTETFPTTVPLIVLATASNKPNYTGTGISAGTTEANILRAVTSQKDVINLLGIPTFMESNGTPLHGHELNEYGAWTLWSAMGSSSLAYYVRADIDLSQLEASDTAPTRGPVDGTYWIKTNDVVGGFFRRNANNTAWDVVPFSVVTTAPNDGFGAVGDIVLDYSTTSGTLKVKTDLVSDKWINMGSVSLTAQAIASRTSSTADVWISDSAPTGAGANDYWWKTSKASGGYDLKLRKYRASDATWVDVTPIRSLTQPTTIASGTIWEDISTTLTDGAHPLKISNGATFSALTFTLGTTAPSRAPADGTYWYSDDYTDFAMYVENDNAWDAIETTTNSNPSSTQKVISASAPTTPSTNAIWIDVSDENFDRFPVVKRYTGAGWEDITASVEISATYTSPTTVPNGKYWINLDDPTTMCTVKVYDSTYQPDVIDGGTGLKASYNSAHGRWKPVAGSAMMRKAQRAVILEKLRAALTLTPGIQSNAINYQLMAAPGYPELYSDLQTLNIAIDERAHVLPDVPFCMVPSGVTVGKEITVTDWKTNARAVDSTNEEGFTSAGSWTAAQFYPHGLTTNVDGATIVVPSSALGLNTLIYSDNQSAPWFAPMGVQRGLVTNASSVGYLTNTGDFVSVNLDQGQSSLLYDNNINIIQNIYRVGLRNMGNKTMYGVAEPRQSLNVARLVSKIKFELKQSMLPFLGQPNDPKTWAQVKNHADRYLAGLITQRALLDAGSRCDEKVNTPERVARKELVCEIAIRPIGAVEFIYVPITIED